VSSWIEKLAGKGRRGGNGVLVQIAREVVGRRRSIQGAISEVRHPAVLDALSDEDFDILGELVEERVDSDREFSQVLARLTHAAAHAKGFDRQTVDAALRLDVLLPADDPAREREKLLRDAYKAAQRSGYVQGGRRALGRLGHRAASADEAERARVLFQQQLDLGPESSDTEDEIDSAIILGDILLRDGDSQGALELYERAGRGADRLDYARGRADSIVRRLDLAGDSIDLETRAEMEEDALRLSTDLRDEVILGQLIGQHANTLLALQRYEDAVAHLEDGLEVAREFQDLELENACLAMLSDVEQKIGRFDAAVDRQRDLVEVEERLGNMPAAAADAVHYASTLLTLGRLDDARDVFDRAIELAGQANDQRVLQRAYGGLGVTLSAMNHPVEALNNLMQALEIARSTQDITHEAQWLGSIGEALWKFDQADDAIQAIHQAIDAAKRVNDLDLEAGMHSLLGQINLADRKIAEAVTNYQDALDLYRDLGRKDEEVSVLSQLGTMAMDVGQVRDAMVLYADALEVAAESGQRPAAVRLYGRLARLAQRQGDMNAALDALTQAVEIAETIDQPVLLNQALQHLAVAQDSANHPDALETYEHALRLSREVGDEYGEALMLTNVGARLLAEGARRDSVEVLEHALHLADSLGVVGEKLAQRARQLVREARGGGGRRFGEEQTRPRQQRPIAAREMESPPSPNIAPITNELQNEADHVFS
jgi:tetratricopeptide (TPR) repeat protein